MPWPTRKPDGDSDGTLSFREKQMMITRCQTLWVEIIRKQLPISIRKDLVFTLQLGFNGSLHVLVRKKGSQTKYETEIPFATSEKILDNMTLPDDFIAKLCILV